MSRLSRVVVGDYPYHAAHRGERRGDMFFTPEDRDRYRTCLAEYAARFHLEVW
jgi:REP element-mobilizing transposase RayT